MFSPPKILYFPLNKSKDLLDFNVELSIEKSEIPEEVKIKVEKSSALRKEVLRTWPTTTEAGPGLFLIQKVPPPFLASPPPGSNQRISLYRFGNNSSLS